MENWSNSLVTYWSSLYSLFMNTKLSFSKHNHIQLWKTDWKKKKRNEAKILRESNCEEKTQQLNVRKKRTKKEKESIASLHLCVVRRCLFTKFDDAIFFASSWLNGKRRNKNKFEQVLNVAQLRNNFHVNLCHHFHTKELISSTLTVLFNFW